MQLTSHQIRLILFLVVIHLTQILKVFLSIQQEKLRAKFKVKLEMAKFLQDTIEETALQRKGAKGEEATQFVNFMEKVRETIASLSHSLKR